MKKGKGVNTKILEDRVRDIEDATERRKELSERLQRIIEESKQIIERIKSLTKKLNEMSETSEKTDDMIVDLDSIDEKLDTQLSETKVFFADFLSNGGENISTNLKEGIELLLAKAEEEVKVEQQAKIIRDLDHDILNLRFDLLKNDTAIEMFKKLHYLLYHDEEINRIVKSDVDKRLLTLLNQEKLILGL